MAEAVIIKPGSSGKANWSVLLGAAFIMATSAIGPGFLTQTAVFTEKFGANFAFAKSLDQKTFANTFPFQPRCYEGLWITKARKIVSERRRACLFTPSL